MSKETKVTIDILSVMINKGFMEVREEFKSARNEFKEVHMEIDEIRDEIKELRSGMLFRFDGLQNQIDNININFIPRREHDLVKDRVSKIERRVGIPRIKQ